jgi:hypothetical protein
MVGRAFWQAAWLVSELQMRFRRILVLFSLGVLVVALLPMNGLRDHGRAAQGEFEPPAVCSLLG